MDSEPRKATDVLLDLESKIDILLDIIRSQDLNIKVLSNKLNVLIENQQKNISTKPTMEIVNNFPKSQIDPKNIPIFAEASLPIENNPQGFRRTSRSETYSEKVKVIPKELEVKNAEIIVPKKAIENTIKEKLYIWSDKSVHTEPEQINDVNPNNIPILQKVVDNNGKSVFLADVEIMNLNNEKISKTRTNGTGKWMASLAPGKYRVILRKRDHLSNNKIEIAQTIVIDGKNSPLNLPNLIFK